jgi:hypothetical protein
MSKVAGVDFIALLTGVSPVYIHVTGSMVRRSYPAALYRTGCAACRE